MNPKDILEELHSTLTPEMEAVFDCATPADAKAWYMRFRRAIDANHLTDTLTVSRTKKTIIITRLTPPPVPVIQNREEI
jgi:hypothetical protein